jgi:hypothetical protein
MAFRGSGALPDVTSEAVSDFGELFAMSGFDGLVQLPVVEIYAENHNFGSRDLARLRNLPLDRWAGCSVKHNAALLSCIFECAPF